MRMAQIKQIGHFVVGLGRAPDRADDDETAGRIAFYDMLPFLITALVLVLGSMKKSRGAQIPASLGLNYFREER